MTDSSTVTNIYDQLQSVTAAQRLDHLIEHLTGDRRAMELFEALKMRSRQRLGLPLIAPENETLLSEDVETQLEADMIDACRTAGTLLLEDGKVAPGWMYLRPTGDLQLARDLLSGIELTPDNHDDMVAVLLNEGVDVARGYQAVLDRQGTCNAITTYQQSIVSRPKEQRQAAAKTLLRHFYSELCQAVRDDISRRMAPADPNDPLGKLIADRPELLSDGGYHLDTTHIASVVQVASLVTDTEDLQKALELTDYGRRLHHQFQYPGEEPYKDFYIAYGTFYRTLLGREVEAGLEYFRRKAEQIDPLEHGTAAIEAYVDLLERTGRPLEAITAATSLAPEGVPPQRIVPMLMDIAKQLSESQRQQAGQIIADYCRQRGDLIGYTAALCES